MRILLKCVLLAWSVVLPAAQEPLALHAIQRTTGYSMQAIPNALAQALGSTTMEFLKSVKPAAIPAIVAHLLPFTALHASQTPLELFQVAHAPATMATSMSQVKPSAYPAVINASHAPQAQPIA